MSRGTGRFWLAWAVIVLGGGGPALAQPPALQAPLDRLLPAPVPVPAPPGAVVPPTPPASLAPAVPPPSPAMSPGSGVVTEACPSCDSAGQPGALLFGADYLLLRPHRQPTDFAVQGSAGAVPQGSILSVEQGYQSGFRVGAGYQFPGEGWQASFFYTYLHSRDTAAASAPDGGTLLATLTHPGTVASVDQAAAEANLNYNVFDVELGRRFQATDRLAVRLFAGPRFAHIDQGLNATYDGGDANHDVVTSHTTFDGGGVRAGAGGNYNLFGGLGLYARGAVSLLAGRVSSCLNETNNNGMTVLTSVGDRIDKVIPVLEMGMGLSWQYGNFRLTAGYEFINWFGLINTPDFVDDVHQGKLTRRSSDLSLDGLVLRAGWSY